MIVFIKVCLQVSRSVVDVEKVVKGLVILLTASSDVKLDCG